MLVSWMISVSEVDKAQGDDVVWQAGALGGCGGVCGVE